MTVRHEYFSDLYEGISIYEMYRTAVEDLPIPDTFRIARFAPPKPKDILFSVISWTVVKATAAFDELCPRLILEEIEPCELCGDREPLYMTEIKKTAKARTYSLMMLCQGCIEINKEQIK